MITLIKLEMNASIQPNIKTENPFLIRKGFSVMLSTNILAGGFVEKDGVVYWNFTMSQYKCNTCYLKCQYKNLYKFYINILQKKLKYFIKKFIKLLTNNIKFGIFVPYHTGGSTWY